MSKTNKAKRTLMFRGYPGGAGVITYATAYAGYKVTVGIIDCIENTANKIKAKKDGENQ